MSKRKRVKQEKSNNGNFSLVVKMNSRLLWRLFTLFLGLDILIILLFTFFIVYKAEENFAGIYQTYASEVTAQDSRNEPDEALADPEPNIPENINLPPNYSIKEGAAPEGWKIHQSLYRIGDNILPESPRYLTPARNTAGIYQAITGLTYSVYNDGIILEYNIGSDFRILAFLFAIILIVEGICFLGRISSNTKLIQESLKPIYEIEQATRSLRNATTPAELAALAGRINKIEAQNLNSRISVDSAQDELKGLADAINDLLERIEEAYRSQARFVSDASHELRTPISVIQGYVNLLDRWGKNDPKTMQESIDAIKNEADNMKDLIEQLLFLARGDNEAMVIHPEVFNLALLAEEVYQESQMIDPNHDIVFVGSGGQVKVEGDIQLIKQAMRILVDNSIKYTPGGEKITVTAGMKNGEALVSVQDNGIGMVPDDLPYIFDRFYRSDDSRARKTGGTGLGLSIAKWIIHRHGGHMEVLSRKDFGTRITLLLPPYTPLEQPEESPVPKPRP